ncbi:hypothetical protein ACM66B_004779 [Microbotryomycetes sp. NB124-2]
MAPTRARRRAQRSSSSTEDAAAARDHDDAVSPAPTDSSPRPTRTSSRRGRQSQTNSQQQQQDSDEQPQVQNDDGDDDEDEDDSDDESSEEEEIYVEPALLSRSRRANAGNRMQQLIQDEQLGAQEARQASATMGMNAGQDDDEMFKEEEGDVDFETKADEKDEFDSDFGSTDSDDDEQDEEDEAGATGSNKRKTRKSKADDGDDDDDDEGRSRKRKKVAHKPFIPSFANQTKYAARQRQREAAAAAAAAANRSTKPGEGDAPVAGPSLSNRPHRPRPGVDPASAFAAPQRESARKSAVQFKENVQQRLEESEKRRAAVSKQVKKQTKSLTQADLIAEALETEEINRASLLAFYAAEEDRRAADRIAGMRYEIIGPKLTYLSRLEQDKDGREDEAEEHEQVTPSTRAKGKGKATTTTNDKSSSTKQPQQKMQSGRRRLIEVIGEAGHQDFDRSNQVKQARYAAKKAAQEDGVALPDKIIELDQRAGDQDGEQSVTAVGASALEEEHDDDDEGTGNINRKTARPVRKDAYARNYLIFGSFDDVSRADEMEALFGDHCDWSKPRPAPLTKDQKHPICPITGLRARYVEPRTGTPYATVEAYQTLLAIVSSLEQSNVVIATGGQGQQPHVVDDRLTPYVFSSTRPRKFKPAPMNEFGEAALPGELVSVAAPLTTRTTAGPSTGALVNSSAAGGGGVEQQPMYYVPQVDVYEDDGIGAFVGLTGVGVWSLIESQRRKLGVDLFGTYYDELGENVSGRAAVAASSRQSGSDGIVGRKNGRKSATPTMTAVDDNPYEKEYVSGTSRSSRRRSRGGEVEVETTTQEPTSVDEPEDSKRSRPPRRSAARKRATYDEDEDEDVV